MTYPTAALLFAAGLGTRMAPLTNDRPKALVEVGGKHLIDHAIAQCPKHLRLVVNTHYLGEQIHQHIAETKIKISHEKSQPLETGGGLKNALPLLQSNPVITLNTDAVWCGEKAIDTLLNAWNPSTMDALLLMIPRANAIGHSGKGDFNLNQNNQVTIGNQYVYSGAQIIRTDLLRTIEDTAFSMWNLWHSMLARQTMYGVEYPGLWCDVGCPQNIAIAENMLSKTLDV